MSTPSHIQAVFDRARCLKTREDVEAALDKMAAEITEKLEDTNPLVLCVMVGGLIPAAGLLSRMAFPLELDYVHATRYGAETAGSELVWKRRPEVSLTDRTVLVIDDILDRGWTLTQILEDCKAEKPKALYSAVLIEKEGVRETGALPHADFAGLLMEDHFLLGYGMDYKGYLRNAPGIYALSDEDF